MTAAENSVFGVVEMGVVGKPIKELLTFQIYGRLLVQMHDEFDLNGDGQLTAVEAADGLVGQPKEVADQLRSVLLDGRKVLARTDKNHDGRIAIVADTAVAAAGDKDHKLVIYPGMAHTMNVTRKFSPEFGEPDKQVITEIQEWLDSHR
ncbi:hypothetical protein [Actinoplanes sp. NPDC089786]|uniref:hypothetical protein n=1 Tax=Actinoplanes sp. NPDC089786 TaxID=3155185 RepID=UPI0034201649